MTLGSAAGGDLILDNNISTPPASLIGGVKKSDAREKRAPLERTGNLSLVQQSLIMLPNNADVTTVCTSDYAKTGNFSTGSGAAATSDLGPPASMIMDWQSLHLLNAEMLEQ